MAYTMPVHNDLETFLAPQRAWQGAQRTLDELASWLGQGKPAAPPLDMTPEQYQKAVAPPRGQTLEEFFAGGRRPAQQGGSMPWDELTQFLGVPRPNRQQLDRMLAQMVVGCAPVAGEPAARGFRPGGPQIVPTVRPEQDRQFRAEIEADQARQVAGLPTSAYSGPAVYTIAGWTPPPQPAGVPLDAATFSRELGIGGMSPASLAALENYFGTAVTPQARDAREHGFKSLLALGSEARQMGLGQRQLDIAQQTENRLGAESRLKTDAETLARTAATQVIAQGGSDYDARRQYDAIKAMFGNSRNPYDQAIGGASPVSPGVPPAIAGADSVPQPGTGPLYGPGPTGAPLNFAEQYEKASRIARPGGPGGRTTYEPVGIGDLIQRLGAPAVRENFPDLVRRLQQSYTPEELDKFLSTSMVPLGRRTPAQEARDLFLEEARRRGVRVGPEFRGGVLNPFNWVLRAFGAGG